MLDIIVLITVLLSGLILLYLAKQSNARQKFYQDWATNEQLMRNAFERTEKELRSNNDKQQQLFTQLREYMQQQSTDLNTKLQRELSLFKDNINENNALFRTNFDKHQFDLLKSLTESLQKNTADIRNEVTQTLNQNAQISNQHINKLTQDVNQQLKEISGQVEKRLTEGFEKTTSTFSEIIKRLSLIDQAQQKITELSTNVVSLQNILADKSSRGAFGEVQMAGLIKNMLPEKSYSLQHTLQNGKRVDCMLLLPDPIGNIAIDAKFPLEDYQTMLSAETNSIERKNAMTRFKQIVKKHIQDIAEKYIIPEETADGAMMFIPAEAVFAEIHANFPDLVELAHKKRVWMVSPTTMMAVLTTASAVLKDVETRKQVHIIQEHLQALAKDFSRFESRMDQLAKHIGQANQDVQEVNVSARKITSRFNKIEQVELSGNSASKMVTEEE